MAHLAMYQKNLHVLVHAQNFIKKTYLTLSLYLAPLIEFPYAVQINILSLLE